jgi:hypothetical protein
VAEKLKPAGNNGRIISTTPKVSSYVSSGVTQLLKKVTLFT